MEEGARVIAGTDHLINLLLNDVGLFTAKADLGTALKQLAVMFQHRVVHSRGLIVDTGAIEVRKVRCWTGNAERPAHARRGIRLRDLLVAFGADARIYVVIGR